MNKIVLGGGCFWGVQAYFQNVKGVVSTRVGYANSDNSETTYKRICDGHDKAYEAVEVIYDDEKIKELDLIKYLFSIINLTEFNKQGPDVGYQYQSCILYDKEVEGYQEYIALIEEKKKIKISVVYKPLENFIEAEEYHQMYLENTPDGYCHVPFKLIKEPKKFEIK